MENREEEITQEGKPGHGSECVGSGEVIGIQRMPRNLVSISLQTAFKTTLRSGHTIFICK